MALDASGQTIANWRDQMQRQNPLKPAPSQKAEYANEVEVKRNEHDVSISFALKTPYGTIRRTTVLVAPSLAESLKDML